LAQLGGIETFAETPADGEAAPKLAIGLVGEDLGMERQGSRGARGGVGLFPKN
jgi:hypothetical protein